MQVTTCKVNLVDGCEKNFSCCLCCMLLFMQKFEEELFKKSSVKNNAVNFKIQLICVVIL